MNCGKEMMLTRNELGRIQDRGICGHGYVCEECATAATEENARLERELEALEYYVVQIPQHNMLQRNRDLERKVATMEADNAELLKRVEMLESDSTKKFNMLMERGAELQELDADNAALRGVVEVVEWREPDGDYGDCVWGCGGDKLIGHSPDCPRQAALEVGG